MTELELVATDFPTSEKFDALMRSHSHVEDLVVHLNGGAFLTASTKEWDDTNDVQQSRGFRAGRHWILTSESGATLRWDVDAVPDSEISDVPRWLILSTEARFDHRLNHHTPEDVWALLPRGQSVRGITFDLQFQKAAPRWRAKGKKLRIGAGMLSGHQASFNASPVINYGALGYEGFPYFIQGSLGQYDRNLIARLDPEQYIFDDGVPDDECSHIVGCTASQFAEAETGGQQITVRVLTGGMGERTPGEWVQHMRAFAYQSGNRTVASGKNLVQAHCIYQCLRGRVDHNSSEGATIFYYGDFLKTKGVEIDFNVATGCYHGVKLALSPTAEGMGNAADQFSHEDYTIGPNNRFSGNGPNVQLDTMGPSAATRFIRNIKVAASLSLENKGAENVTRIGAAPVTPPAPKGKRGCLLSMLPF